MEIDIREKIQLFERELELLKYASMHVNAGQHERRIKEIINELKEELASCERPRDS